MRVGAIVLAAGSSRRMGGGDKLLADLAGRPVLSRTLSAFEECDAIDDMVVVTSPANRAAVTELCRGLSKVRALVNGGRERQDSVWAGLSTLRAADIVAVHDGARPLITPGGIAACIERAREGTSVIAGGPAVDTIKVVDDGERVQATPDRQPLRAVATPQVFLTATLRQAHEAAQRDDVLATDDAALVERLGEPVVVHDLGAPNPKITSPEDLSIAEALLGARSEVRTGIGIDSHRFGEGRRLVLGGVEILGEVGLAGHSDADVLTHAIIDALLGAAGLGDIGAQFGTGDPRWSDGDSTLMLVEAVSKLAEAGARPQSVDATVIAERPRLRPYIERMRMRLSEALQLDISAVNVAATTAEGMGALGRAEGIAAHAVATVRMRRGVPVDAGADV
ncbi:MAG: 2-C-methyl-D-erythritol 4-phosphate cytidylyltransferase [Chloroflexi bacterium]|nr:2-C-methyl-D-erythritol 4-phosphate cytidylyltransferase [Chloroflexota bacterium]MCY3695994.1 2-C-methyl-D-erythritol 4-phosphate cytidylyltransferase [Chloroflexota bacterium]MXX79743.1 2-C-methyl-D-erythritol 4-phosphate cytidylyltransferase [Chloroflexota bacterium]MYF22287.1 2-C-methyl-D-erythritol 4-phosphate cytidylyltransferase [Chloroflexota bacterium]